MAGNKDITVSNYFRNLSAKDFLTFGIQHIAYIRPIHFEDRTTWSVHAADGTPLTVLESEEIALALVRHNELEPVTVQ